jgi:hypothetical protein
MFSYVDHIYWRPYNNQTDLFISGWYMDTRAIKQLKYTKTSKYLISEAKIRRFLIFALIWIFSIPEMMPSKNK